MENETINSDLAFNLPPNKSSVIKVIGVGGGGSNAVNHMKTMGIKDVDFIVCNTDAQALGHSTITNKIQLGVTLTEGLGAGANPEVGKNAAVESLEELKQTIESNTKMLFITAGMGGGTGTGAAPIIAKLSRELNLLTVAVVTMPFSFEGKSRMKQAEEGLKELRNHVDSLIIIKNDKLREVYGNLGFRAGFSKADVILATGVKAIAEVITHHYRANIDLEDAKRVLANSGTAIMGSAVAEGENRAPTAINKALDSPLLNDNHIKGAKNVLLLIVSGSEDNEITFDEIGEINEHIQSEAGGNTNIILGIGEDKDLGEKISVTVIATGFDRSEAEEVSVQDKSKKKIPLGTDTDLPTNNSLTEDDKPLGNKPSPLDAPIAKSNVNESVDAVSQTDLFAEIQTEKTKSIEPLEETTAPLVSNNIEEIIIEEQVVEEHFEDPSNENEILLEVTPTSTGVIEEPILESEIELEKLPETEEDFIADSPLALEHEENNFASAEAKPELVAESIEEENLEEEESFSFDIIDEKEDAKEIESFEVNANADFVIVDEEPEIKTPLDYSIENTAEKMDPLNFKIEQVIGKPEKEKTSPLEAPLPTADSGAEKSHDDGKITHSLEDLENLEALLGVGKTKKQESTKTVETPKSEEIEFKVVTKEPKPFKEETNPLESSIQQISKEVNLKRKSRLQEFNYSFKKNAETLNTPAFKRAGIDIQNDGFSTESPLSNTIVKGEGENIAFSGNSFLHDNVD